MSQAREVKGLLREYLSALDRLRPYRIDSIADFAEYLFAEALNGERVTRGQKGHDVIAPNLGRVQVKARRLPADGRKEERLHLDNITGNSCDYLGAVIFANDCSVHKATLVPHNAVWRLLQSHADPERKVQFKLIASLPEARDVSEQIRRVLD